MPAGRKRIDQAIPGTWLKEVRLHQGLTQKELARHIELSASWVQQVESGATPLSQQRAERIALLLHSEAPPPMCPSAPENTVVQVAHIPDTPAEIQPVENQHEELTETKPRPPITNYPKPVRILIMVGMVVSLPLFCLLANAPREVIIFYLAIACAGYVLFAIKTQNLLA